jgi:hypothetical protein
VGTVGDNAISIEKYAIVRVLRSTPELLDFGSTFIMRERPRMSYRVQAKAQTAQRSQISY